MRVLGIITARGGSKGIPRKNIIPLLGKPLLQWTADAALAAKRLTRVVLSTDDPEIAEVAQQCGVEVPFFRPPELARDDTPTIPVLQDVVRRLAAAGETYDAVLTLQPTNPLRQAADIDGAIELLEKTGADSVHSFTPSHEFHPSRIRIVNDQGQVDIPDFGQGFQWKRRQELPAYYIREGSIYLTKTTVLLDQDSISGNDCRAWIIPEARFCNLDELFQIPILEALIQYGREHSSEMQGYPAVAMPAPKV